MREDCSVSIGFDARRVEGIHAVLIRRGDTSILVVAQARTHLSAAGQVRIQVIRTLPSPPALAWAMVLACASELT